LAAENFRCLRTGSEGDISTYERHRNYELEFYNMHYSPHTIEVI